MGREATVSFVCPVCRAYMECAPGECPGWRCDHVHFGIGPGARPGERLTTMGLRATWLDHFVTDHQREVIAAEAVTEACAVDFYSLALEEDVGLTAEAQKRAAQIRKIVGEAAVSEAERLKAKLAEAEVLLHEVGDWDTCAACGESSELQCSKPGQCGDLDLRDAARKFCGMPSLRRDGEEAGGA